MDPPGLRRLRFPFFDSLVKELGAKRPQRPVRLAPPRSSWKRGRPPGRPRRASRSIQRLPAHCRAPVRGARSPLTNLNRDPCQRVGEQILYQPVPATLLLAAKRPALQRTERVEGKICAGEHPASQGAPPRALAFGVHFAFGLTPAEPAAHVCGRTP